MPANEGDGAAAAETLTLGTEIVVALGAAATAEAAALALRAGAGAVEDAAGCGSPLQARSARESTVGSIFIRDPKPFGLRDGSRGGPVYMPRAFRKGESSLNETTRARESRGW